MATICSICKKLQAVAALDTTVDCPTDGDNTPTVEGCAICSAAPDSRVNEDSESQHTGELFFHTYDWSGVG